MPLYYGAGATGTTGPTGATGATGPTGPTGAAGADATPAYDIGIYHEGVTTADQVVLGFLAVRDVTLPVNLTGSGFIADVAATAITTFTLKQGATTIGTATFAAAGTTATFSFVAPVVISAGQKFDTIAPTVPDVTLAGLHLTYKATRAA